MSKDKELALMDKIRAIWWCSLHEEALKRIGTNWIRPSDFTDRPEVVRDIASLGLIESMEEKKGQYTILWWRLKTNQNTNKFQNTLQ